jgi:hypothetical protein
MEQQYKSLYLNVRDLMDKTSSEREDIESQLDSVTKRFYASDYHIGALVTLKTRSRLHKALHRVLVSLKKQECTDLTALHGLVNAYLKRLRKLATEQYVTPEELRMHYKYYKECMDTVGSLSRWLAGLNRRRLLKR